jgi:hypothetical protein
MVQVIEVEGQRVEFPDEMSDAQIAEAIRENIRPQILRDKQQDIGFNVVAEDPEQTLRRPPENDGRLQPEIVETEEGFFDNLARGFGFTDETGTFKENFDRLVLEDSFVGRAGAFLTEKGFELFGQEEMVENARRAEKYEEWQPKIWKAQQELDLIGDPKSPEYTEKANQIKDLRRNFRDDLEGKYVPVEEEEEPFDWGEFYDLVSENKAFMTGAIARGLIADPELLILPGGWTRSGILATNAAKAAGIASKPALIATRESARVGGSFVLGASLGAAGEIIQQVDDDPEAPIDFARVGDTALLTGAITAPFPLVGTVATGVAANTTRRLKDIASARAVKSVEEVANQKFADNIDADGVPQLNKQAAIDQTIAELKITPEAEVAFREGVENVDDLINTEFAQIRAAERIAKEAAPTRTSQILQSAGELKDSFTDGFNGFVQPITSQLRNMGLKSIAGRLNQHDLETGTMLAGLEEVRNRFAVEFNNLTEAQQQLAKLRILNSEFRGENQNGFPKSFIDEFENTRNALDDELLRAREQGIDLPGVEDFFPRRFKYKEFGEAQGFKPAQTNKAIADAINTKQGLTGEKKLTAKDITEFPNLAERHLTPQEIAQALGRDIFKGGEIRPTVSGDSLKARTVDKIRPEMLQWYDSPTVSLGDHFNRMTIKIQDRKFFGGKGLDKNREIIQGAEVIDDASMISGFIDDMAGAELGKKNITPAQRDKLVQLLRARFVGSKKQTTPFIRGARNYMYAATLGNPVAAATQLGDLGASAYLNGTYNAIEDLVVRSVQGANNIRRGQGQAAFKLEDFGLQALPDVEDMGRSRQLLDWSLRKGGFRAMDRLGKEAIMNSTWSKLQKIANKPRDAALRDLRVRYGQRLADSEVEAIYDGILSGDTANPHVRLAVFSDLTRVQPVSMSEMPMRYLNHPDARIFFMLKTFTLKQIDLMRQEVIKNIADGVKAGDTGQVAAGAYNMAKIVGTIGGANMGVEATKRFIAGEDFEPTDLMVSTILRNYGLSQYTLDQLARGKIGGFVGQVVQPPTGVFFNPIMEGINTVSGGQWGVDTNGRWIDSFPLGRGVRTALEATGQEDLIGADGDDSFF